MGITTKESGTLAYPMDKALHCLRMGQSTLVALCKVNVVDLELIPLLMGLNMKVSG